MKEFAIHPGEIVSKNDDDVHYITYNQLIRLYKLNPKKCFRWDKNGHNWNDYKHFFPKTTGNY